MAPRVNLYHPLTRTREWCRSVADYLQLAPRPIHNEKILSVMMGHRDLVGRTACGSLTHRINEDDGQKAFT